MDLKIGEEYWVPCAEIMMNDGRLYYIPVLDHLHVDPQFDFPHEHYHIDGRFYIHPRMEHQFQIEKGWTSSVIVPETSTSYRFLSIAVQYIKCERLSTGLVIPTKPTDSQRSKLAKYEEWYHGYIGRICKGRKCPHFGTEMLEKDGVLICPMHGLTADSATLIIVQRSPDTISNHV